MDVDVVTGEIVDSSISVHRELGPGLLESVYQTVLAMELEARGLKVEPNKHVVFEYRGITFREGLKIDLLIDDLVIVELKSVEALHPVHAKQLLTYLRLMRLPVGLLINFGGATLKEGLKRVVNNYRPPEDMSSPRLSVLPRPRVTSRALESDHCDTV